MPKSAPSVADLHRQRELASLRKDKKLVERLDNQIAAHDAKQAWADAQQRNAAMSQRFDWEEWTTSSTRYASRTTTARTATATTADEIRASMRALRDRFLLDEPMRMDIQSYQLEFLADFSQEQSRLRRPSLERMYSYRAPLRFELDPRVLRVDESTAVRDTTEQLDFYRHILSTEMKPKAEETTEMDYWLRGRRHLHTDSFVAVPHPDSARPNDLVYWTTDGRISPADVARVLARYYNSEERMKLLTRWSEMDLHYYGAETLHPDHTQCRLKGSVSPHRRDEWQGNTESLWNRCFTWVPLHQCWCRCIRLNGVRQYIPLDPHHEGETFA